MLHFLFKPDSWQALVELTHEAESRATAQGEYVALSIDEAGRRTLVALLRRRLRQDAGSEPLFRALMLLGGPIGPPPFVWPAGVSAGE